jgi:hypothetical protein
VRVKVWTTFPAVSVTFHNAITDNPVYCFVSNGRFTVVEKLPEYETRLISSFEVYAFHAVRVLAIADRQVPGGVYR